MTQEDMLLYEIEKRGGFITTWDLMKLGISQYQARLKGLREKLAVKGVILTRGNPVAGQKRNFLYRIIHSSRQLDLL